MSNLPLSSDKKDRQFLNGVEQTDEELKQYNYLNLGPTRQDELLLLANK